MSRIGWLALLIGAPATAQPTRPDRQTVGVDVAGVVPVSDEFAKFDGVGGGGLVRVEFPVGGGFAFLRGGLIFHRGPLSTHYAPIDVGYRLPLGASGVYAAGELGAVVFSTNDNKDVAFGGMLSLGLRRGPFDLRAGLIAPHLDGIVGFIASIGYDLL